MYKILPKNQLGVIHLLIPLLLLIIGGVVFSAFVFFGKFNNPFPSVVDQVKKQSSQAFAVVLKNDYKNPFDKTSQYVNPFAQYKNPFDAIR